MIIKALSSRLAIAFLAIATGLLTQATVASQDLQRRDLPFLQAENNENKEPLKVSLPSPAQVMIKSGGSKSGQVIQIDSQGQKLVLKYKSGETLSLPLDQVEKVVFKNGNVVHKSNGEMVLRGGGDTNISPAGGQVSLPEISLNAFTLKDANKGLAEVTLGPGGLSRGIRDTAKNRQFFVDEMQFNLPKKTMMIKATPYSLM